MKEDVLEQVVDDYLKFKGYFTIHNVRFKPRSDHPDFVAAQDSVRSDVDVVGYHPGKGGVDRVIVVSCKAWQAGFDATAKLAELRGEKKNLKRATWRHFRELWVPKWSEAFRAKIVELTGVENFSYRVAVTRLRGDTEAWANDPTILANLSGCPLCQARLLNRVPAAGGDVGRHAQRADDYAGSERDWSSRAATQSSWLDRARGRR